MRRLGLAVGCSLALHSSVLVWVLKPDAAIKPQVVLEIAIISKPKPKPRNFKPKPAPLRVGSAAFKRAPHNLGVHLTADHYLNRLKAQLDPVWAHRLDLALRRKEATAHDCYTTLNIDASPDGTIIDLVVQHTTCDIKLDNIAKAAIMEAGLLPPPKNLLVNGRLYLEWTFTLRRKDD